MPRQARLDAPGLLYHVIGRGIEGGKIFSDDQDRFAFLDRLGKVAIDTATPVYAFALIPNHFHLLLRRGGTPLSRVMQRLLTSYALKFNKRHRRSGYLFQNRYKSIICQEESYFLELVRYIHLNPVRAKIVSSIEEMKNYRFSGHSLLVGKSRASWFDRSEVLGRFGLTEAKAQRVYLTFLKDGINLATDLSGGGLKRSSGPTELSKTPQAYDERILGESNFVENLLLREEKAAKTAVMADPNQVEESVCRQTAISLVEMQSETKRPAVAKARALVAFRLAHFCGLSGQQIADRIEVSRSAASRLIVKGRALD